MFQRIQKVYGVAQNMLAGRDQYTTYAHYEKIKTAGGKEKRVVIYNPNPNVRFLWRITKTFNMKGSTEKTFLKRLKGQQDLEQPVGPMKRMKCVVAATSSKDGKNPTAEERAQAEKFCTGVKKYLAELTKKPKTNDDWPVWAHILVGALVGIVTGLLIFFVIGPWISKKLHGDGGHGGLGGGGGGGASVDDIARASAMGAMIAAGVLSGEALGEAGEATEGAEAAEAASKTAAMTAATKRLASAMSPSMARNPFAIPAYGAQGADIIGKAGVLNSSSKPLTWTQMGWGAVGLMAIGAAVYASSKLPDKGRVVLKEFALGAAK
jgi:hypothetical protein